MRRLLAVGLAALGLVAVVATSARADADAVRTAPDPTATTATAATITTLGYKTGVGAWQVQTLAVLGSVGTFTLQYGSAITPELSATAPACRPPGTSGWCSSDSVQYALNHLGANALVSDGPDGVAVTPLTRYTIRFVDPDASPLVARTAGSGPGPITDVACVFCIDTETAPPANANGAAIVYVHGGGFVAGDRANSSWSDARARFEAAGYRTYSMNYRLMNGDAAFYGPTGLGPVCDWSTPPPTGPCRTWRAAADAASADVNAAVAFVRGQAAAQGVDPNRVAVLGSSAGAIAALNNHYLPATPEGQPAATISLSGIMDPARQRGPAGPVLLFEFGRIDPVYAGNDGEGIDAQQHDEAIVAQAQALGNKAYLRTYPGAGHDIAPGSPYYEDAIRTTLAFLAEQLRPAPPAGVLGGLWLGTAASFTLGRGQSLGDRAGTGTPAPEAIVGDFNGDGRSDVLWRDPITGPDTVWSGGADGVLHDPRDWGANAVAGLPGGIGAEDRAVVADVNGDGVSDVAWSDPIAGTQVHLWLGHTSGAFTTVDSGPLPSGFHLSTADTNGDHRADLVVHWPGAHSVGIWRFDGSSFAMAFARTDAGAADPVAGDFNGDGATDLYWPGVATKPLWLGDLSGAAMTPIDAPAVSATHQGIVGDVNGDGLADVAWYDPATGTDTQLFTAGASGTFTITPLGTVATHLEWYVADTNGDGRQDLMVYAPARHGALLLRGGTTFSLAYVNTDLPAGAEPAVGDFDGDGRADLLWH